MILRAAYFLFLRAVFLSSAKSFVILPTFIISYCLCSALYPQTFAFCFFHHTFIFKVTLLKVAQVSMCFLMMKWYTEREKRSSSVLRGRVGHLWAGRRWKRRGGDEKHWITCLTMEMDYLGLSRYFRVRYQQCLGFWPKGERCSIRNERKERKKQLWWQPKEYIHKSSAGEHKVTSHPCHPFHSKLYNPRFRCAEK